MGNFWQNALVVHIGSRRCFLLLEAVLGFVRLLGWIEIHWPSILLFLRSYYCCATALHGLSPDLLVQVNYSLIGGHLRMCILGFVLLSFLVVDSGSFLSRRVIVVCFRK
jgi:hypothetical protein